MSKQTRQNSDPVEEGWSACARKRWAKRVEVESRLHPAPDNISVFRLPIITTSESGRTEAERLAS